MPSLVLCYAPEDEALARQLGGYLETNLPYEVSYGECVVGPGLDLVDAAERALSAEAALVLLSPHSVPKVWNRQKWEPVFFQTPAELGTQLGFVLLQECRFPELIRRHRFFEATCDLQGAVRTIRRWLLRPNQPLQSDGPLDEGTGELRGRAGDQPAFAADIDHASAMAFAQACAEDFEAVHVFDCLGRTKAGMLGDIGNAIGLKMPGNVEQNRETLRQRCRAHRYLFLLDNAPAAEHDFLNFGGLASIVCTVNSPARERVGLESIGPAFLANPRDEADCARLLADAVICATDLLGSDFEAGLRLGWALVSFLRAAERFAEAVEVLDSMEKAARDKDDALALYQIEWEQSWLRETSADDGDIRILPTASAEITQLSLFT